MSKISFKEFLVISRPISFILLLLCIAVAFFFSADVSQLNIFHILEFIMIIFLLPFFIFSINDYYDLESDIINNRKGNLLQGKIISKEVSKKDIDRINLIIFFVFIVYSLIFRNITHTILIFSMLFFSYLYSAKPLRFKEIPFIDSLSNGAIVFSVFAVVYSLFNTIWSLPAGVIAVAVSIIFYHLLMAQIDKESDIKAGQMTTAVFLKSKLAVYLLCVLYNLPLLAIKFNSCFRYLFYFNIVILGYSSFNEEKSKSIVFMFIVVWTLLLLLYIFEKLC
jgi:lycopene elongase/hydratase (dihydrobisanhydrobacterioruberin-forming)